MLSTQLSILFEQIAMQENIIEDIARLLAQAAVSEGTIFLAAFGEMKAVCTVALDGDEPLPAVREWQPESYVTSADRVFILAKKDEGDELAGRLSDAAIPFAMLCTATKESDLPDAMLSLGIDKGGLHAMAALYVYHSIKLIMDEMMGEAAY